MKVLHKIFLILCRVFTTLCKKRKSVSIDLDSDGKTDITIEISQDSKNYKGEDENEISKLL